MIRLVDLHHLVIIRCADQVKHPLAPGFMPDKRIVSSDQHQNRHRNAWNIIHGVGFGSASDGSQGVSIRYVAALIGDSVATCEKHYGHVIQDDLRKEVAGKLPSFGGAP